MKILIIDDSSIARLFITSCLPKDFGLEIKEAVNGKEAMDIIPEFKPNLVFMDITMPVMNGYETIEKIKDCCPKIQVVIVSADIQKTTVKKMMDMGARKFLKKPVTKSTIAEIIEEIKADEQNDKI
jgi:YesN/AraC family two-component response regulator